jgi:hypothetical protein
MTTPAKPDIDAIRKRADAATPDITERLREKAETLADSMDPRAQLSAREASVTVDADLEAKLKKIVAHHCWGKAAGPLWADIVAAIHAEEK